MTADNILELVKIVGVPATLLLFYVYRDYQRERALSLRISAIEDYQREKLEKLVVESSAVVTQNTAELKSQKNEFRRRPCIAPYADNQNGL